MIAWTRPIVPIILLPFAIEPTTGHAAPPGSVEASIAAPGEARPVAWGVQLSGAFSREEAIAAFERMRKMFSRVIPDEAPVVTGAPVGNRGPGPFYRVYVRAASRDAADTLCATIKVAGGSCIVLPLPVSR